MVPKEGMLPQESIEGESLQRVLMRRIEDSNLQDNSRYSRTAIFEQARKECQRVWGRSNGELGSWSTQTYIISEII
jgi:hypothetical protein